MKHIVTVSLFVASCTILAIGAILFLSPNIYPAPLEPDQLVVTPQESQSSGSPEVQPLRPPISWDPAQVTLTLAPGETKQVRVTATIRSAIPATIAQLVPALVPYVSASPSSLSGMTTGSQQEFVLTVTVPVSTAYQTVEGTLHIRSGTHNAPLPRHYLDEVDPSVGTPSTVTPALLPSSQGSTIPKPLPIKVNVWQRVSDSHSGVSFLIPPRFSANQGDGYIAIGDPTTVTPLFIATPFPTPPDIASLPLEEALDGIAHMQIEAEDFLSTDVQESHLLVEATTFPRFHLFVYHPTTNQAVEFTAGSVDFLSSAMFATVLDSLNF